MPGGCRRRDTGGTVDIFWFAGMSCDGCSIAATGAEAPALERLQRGVVTGMPRIQLHHPLFAMEAGTAFLEDHRKALRDELGRPYVVVLEGSASDEELAGEGYWAALGSGGLYPGADNVIDGVRQPTATMEWVRALAPRAAAVIALGTCASWGGVPAAYGSVTGAMSLAELLGTNYRSSLGLPVVNLPGCAPVGDNIMETIAALLLFLEGIGPVPEFDELGRPAWLFRETAHRSCVRAGYYEEGSFAKHPGDAECLVEMGCWGAVVECNMSTRGAINGVGGCMNTGGACIGCTMPGFPDQFSPFYQTSVGAALSKFASKDVNGIRRLQSVANAVDPSPSPPELDANQNGAWTFLPAMEPRREARAAFYERWRVLAGIGSE